MVNSYVVSENKEFILVQVDRQFKEKSRLLLIFYILRVNFSIERSSQNQRSRTHVNKENIMEKPCLQKHSDTFAKVVFLIAFVLAIWTGFAFAEANTLLILDASGSMRGRIEDQVKMDMAKDVTCDYVKSLPADMNVGLLVYGHRSREDCNDMEYIVPLGKNNRDTLIKTIKGLKPMGKTPITLSLDKAVTIIDSKQGDDNTILLISDGKESCDADPCSLIAKYIAQGKHFVCHVIGFDVDRRTEMALKCIADAGNGKYYTAANMPGFKVAIEDVKKSQPVAVAPPKPVPAPQPDKKTRLKTGTLTLQKDTFIAGERIWIHFSTPEQYSDKAWIGIIPSHIPHGDETLNDNHDLSYKYLNKATAGDLEFSAPGTPGNYDFRMHDTDNNGVEVASVSFTVVQGSATMALSKTTLICGEKFEVHFQTQVNLSNKAWMGIVPSEIPHGDEDRNDQHDISYQYLGGKNTGTLTFNAPSKPGTYDMRLHDTDDHGSEIGSATFTVTMGAASVSLPKTQYQSGEPLIVSFSSPSNLSPKAWIGIIPSDIPHGNESRNDQFDIAYKYLNGKQQGSLDFVAPSKAGSYDFRLNDTDNDGNELASVSFIVSPSSGSLSLTKTEFSPGETIWLTFTSSITYASNAWVGILPANIPHGSEQRNDQHDISYQYVKGKQGGTLEFKAPDKPGSYDFRLNDSDDQGNEVATVSFQVR